MSAGYSTRTLADKLGYRGRVWAVDMPATVAAEIVETTPIDWTDRSEGATAAHIFVMARTMLERLLSEARAKLSDDAMIWVSWPKRAARIATDVTEDTVREVALPLGFVDVKVCAVDKIWSGLKLVVRRELRGT